MYPSYADRSAAVVATSSPLVHRTVNGHGVDLTRGARDLFTQVVGWFSPLVGHAWLKASRPR